jgi:hypothetical protein
VGDPEVIGHGQLTDERSLLVNGAHTRSAGGDRSQASPEGAPEQPDIRALIGIISAGDQPNEGRLA